MVTPALDSIRARQLGCWTRRQAVAIGIPHSTLRRWVDTGRVTEVFPGVMVSRGQPVDWEVRAVAARLWAGGDAVLARQSAARVLGLRLPKSEWAGPVHLIVHERTFTPPPGLVVHRSSRPLAHHEQPKGPHLTTNPSWTLCDLAGVLPSRHLRRMLAHAVRAGHASPAQLRETMDFRGRFRGKAGLRQLVDELSPLETHTRSELESLYIRVMTPRGLAPDVVNHPVVDATGARKILDAAYLPEHLPIELDSEQEHGTLLDWNDDRRRENRIILAAPWRSFLRFGWDDLVNHADEVAALVRTALIAAGTTRL